MKPDLRARALNYLARREYSRDELYRKLLPHAEDRQALEDLLADFGVRGWLSERRFAEQVVRARQAKYGSLRIAHELREKGVAQAVVDAALAEVRAGELETAQEVWRRKFGTLPADAADHARQTRFLQSRGFAGEVIRKVLRQRDDD